MGTLMYLVQFWSHLVAASRTNGTISRRLKIEIRIEREDVRGMRG